MEGGEVLRGQTRTHPVARGWSRTFGLLNPLRAAWWLFTNVRFALVLLAVLCIVSMLGVVLPQKPLVVRADILAEASWLDVQEGRFGPLTEPAGPRAAVRRLSRTLVRHPACDYDDIDRRLCHQPFPRGMAYRRAPAQACSRTILRDGAEPAGAYRGAG